MTNQTVMKIVTRISLVAAALAAVVSTTAFAGNEPHQTQLALERARTPSTFGTERTTIALYSHQHGSGIGHADRRMERQSSADTYGEPSEGRFVLRSNGHGGFFGLWESAK